MRESLANHRTILYRDEQLAEDYLKRFNETIHRCSNFQEDKDKMNLWIHRFPAVI